MASAGTGPTSEGATISLPSGGGAIRGLGETFSPDLFTGTGNFSVPIALPAGRNGLAPQLALVYSTGNGNGPFGLGWALSLPGVSRRTSRGVPRYGAADAPPDTFVLSGAEDLIPMPDAVPGRARYRPRTEGLFARIEHVTDPSDDYWEVQSRDGLRSRYGTPRPPGADPGWHDPAVIMRPGDDARFAWRITETADLLGNLIRYSYLRDHGDDPGHSWDQPLLARIDYADYGDRAQPAFLIGVEFDYEPRPDPFSDYRAGFDARTSLRCRAIRILTRAADGVRRVAREYRLTYAEAAFNGASMLVGVDAFGIDETAQRVREPLPPLTFGYSRFAPERRRFRAVAGPGLPTSPLSDPNLALVDLHGNGLPDILEMGSAQRYWANRGDGRFDLPRSLGEAPPHTLGDPGVRIVDADGDGRPDLLVTAPAQAGYFPMDVDGGRHRAGFRPYHAAPSVALDDPRVRLVDLDGDGLTDLLYSGSGLRSWFNDADPRRAWQRTAPARGPDLDLADPHVRMADMTGDGLQDLVLVRSGNVVYWPSLGHGRFGPAVQMRGAPRLPDGHDPRRVLLGDVDGDGVADLVYVDRGRVLLWGNRTGNDWTPSPVVVTGTPDVADSDAVLLVDLHGTGMAGLLWSTATNGSGPALRFLDLTGGVKPYLLDTIDNHLGAITEIEYRPSTAYAVADQADPGTRWRTSLPFPVQVVARTAVTDAHSGGRHVTEYRYRHGHWDGVERAFRGFAMVEQRDAETFPGDDTSHSPPTLTRSWFHLGTDFELDHEFWPGDPAQLVHPQLPAGLSASKRRDGLRALRGHLLRSELYALDGTDRADRPYTVTESVAEVRAVAENVWSAFTTARRTTQWERGHDPMTQYLFTEGHDDFGLPTSRLAVAVPRGRDPRVADPAASQPYLATSSTTLYARRSGLHVADRIARTSSFEVVNDGRVGVLDLRDAVRAEAAELRLIGHRRTYYDGPRYEGLPLGELGDHGLAVRSEALAFTDAFLAELFPAGRPPYLNSTNPINPMNPTWADEYPAAFRALVKTGYRYHGDLDVPGPPGGYYVTDVRQAYDVHDPARVPRGLLVASLDPFGAESHVAYDEHDLLQTRATDPAGLVIGAEHDLRLLQPATVTDPNGNTTTVTFSPAGLVTGRFVRGKNGEGDATLPSVRTFYDLMAFDREGRPASVRTERRLDHDTAVPAGAPDDAIVSVAYFDGFGRLLQTRAQAESTIFGDPDLGGQVIPAGPGVPAAETRGTTRADHVTVSGWQTYDNKGRVIERYDPFFAKDFDYHPPTDSQLGQRTTIFYDPRGHAVRTRHPDGGEQVVVLGVPVDLARPDLYAPTPWETFSYDANDNAGRTHPATSAPDRDHRDTPASIEVDALGRTVVATARTATDELTSRFEYDLQGNLVTITDALGRAAFRNRFDLAGRQWRADGVDAGRHDAVPDAVGSPIESRDAKGALVLVVHDVLHRPLRVWARDRTDGPVTLRQRLGYGDAGDRTAARARNLLGRVVAHHDEAGLVEVTEVDFKGNVLESARRVLADAALLEVYERAPADGWQVTPFAIDWDRAAADLLDPSPYRTRTTYDALNRVTRHLLPTDVEGRRRELVPRYNRAGGLQQVRLDDDVYVRQIAYDADGQRTLIVYGNGVVTRYAYDPRTSRLARMLTQPCVLDGETYRANGAVLQDCGYDYDLVGNLLAVRDRTPGSGVPNTPAGADALDRRFGYDPLYRLVEATGRECDLPPDDPPWYGGPRSTDLTRTRAYTETYGYDAVGSLLRLTHRSGTTAVVRQFSPEDTSNRLRTMTAGSTPIDYRTDAVGNVVGETTSRHFAWNHSDRLAAFATQTPGAEPSLHAQYLYDSAGQRVTKLVRRQGGAVEVTHYLGDVEHHRWSTGANNHVHVMDDASRIALVRIGPAAPGDGGVDVQYHLGDHLGSSTLVVDQAGAVTNREEYTPYGQTSFGSFGRKRYRFTGKERDEESGLSYHSARYFMPWTARWLSTDPLGAAAGHNLYTYAAGNPVRLVDPTGLQASRAELDRATRDVISGVMDKDQDHVISDQEFDDAFSRPGKLVPQWADLVLERGPGSFRLGSKAQGFVHAMDRARMRGSASASQRAGPVPTPRELELWRRQNPRTQDDLIRNSQYTGGLSFGAILWYGGADESTVDFVNGMMSAGGGTAAGRTAFADVGRSVSTQSRPTVLASSGTGSSGRGGSRAPTAPNPPGWGGAGTPRVLALGRSQLDDGNGGTTYLLQDFAQQVGARTVLSLGTVKGMQMHEEILHRMQTADRIHFNLAHLGDLRLVLAEGRAFVPGGGQRLTSMEFARAYDDADIKRNTCFHTQDGNIIPGPQFTIP